MSANKNTRTQSVVVRQWGQLIKGRSFPRCLSKRVDFRLKGRWGTLELVSARPSTQEGRSQMALVGGPNPRKIPNDKAFRYPPFPFRRAVKAMVLGL
ncbi:hypothetical protein CDAR_32941 [Caerostris darwini]|uniref:Uncharacterized protein n=1 Tax=Caerostris darwini TaxID=1538125 RepID=A0AAV4SKA8_9ARAC|nr:hypothetical protein CDAR_32941 [Caerostris darwini]